MASNRIEQKVDIFKPLLLEAIPNPVVLIKSLSFITEGALYNYCCMTYGQEKRVPIVAVAYDWKNEKQDEKTRIQRVKKVEGSGKATELILDIISSRRDVKGRWNQFVAALENNDFDFVAASLSNNYINESQELRRLIKTFSRPIAYRVKVTQILPTLRKRELITRQDGEEIEAEFKCKGPVAAFIVLLDRIPVYRQSSWFDVFLGILVDSGYGDIANEVDEEFADERYGQINSANDVFNTRNVPVFSSENQTHTGNQRDQYVIPGTIRCKPSETIDFSTCTPPARVQSSNRSQPQRLSTTSFPSLSKSTACPDTSPKQNAASSLDVNASYLRPGHQANYRYRRLITVADLHDAFTKIGFDFSRSSEGMKAVGNVNTTSNNDATHSLFGQDHLAFSATETEETNLKRPMRTLVDRSDYTESRHPSNVLGTSSTFGTRGSINVTYTRSSNNSSEFDNQPLNSFSFPSFQEETELKSLPTTASENNGSMNCYPRTAENLLIRKNNRLCQGERRNNGSFEDKPRNNGQTDVSNLQRMGEISEDDLRRKRKHIYDERHQNQAACDRLNIDYEQESVIDNDDYQYGSSDDDDDDDDDELHLQVKNINLRGYQQELVAPGIQGRNCMVVAPTGSGKTLVAMKVIQEHFKQMQHRRNPKVVFLVEQSQLAEQQYKVCEEYFGDKVKVITGEVQRRESYQEVAGWLVSRDILVMTAQLLVNALKANDVDIKQFTLLVFDECHHTNLKHSFNQIMHAYLELKLEVHGDDDRRRLPQVIGLTASVGVGKAKNKDKAVEWIQKMMAHLDAEEIVTVQENIHELRRHASPADQRTLRTKRRQCNIFGEVVSTELMEEIEKMMANSHHAVQIPGHTSVLRNPRDRGNDQYTQWLSNLKKQSAALEDREARRFIVACHKYLEIYNKAMIIYADARIKDALSFLEDEIVRLNEHAQKDATDFWLETHFRDYEELLTECKYIPQQSNPKLDALEKILIKQFRKNPDSRCIIFVKTRDLVNAIHRWMSETQELKRLGSVPFVGVQASIQQGGMTRHEQVDVLQFFRDGKHKVIIATSVAEEGLDIRKCNLVIRYDHVTNEIAMVQSRGRGRADDSKYILLTEEGGWAAKKEEINKMREKMMEEAIAILQEKLRNNRRAVLRDLLEIQRNEFLKRDIAEMKRAERVDTAEYYDLLCNKCSRLICHASDVRLIMDAHHAVLNPEISLRITAQRVSKAKYKDHIIQCAVGKIFCGECGLDLGNITIYNGAQFPVIKIENFIILHTGDDSRMTAKAWKQAPFAAQALSVEDQRRWIDSNASNILH